MSLVTARAAPRPAEAAGRVDRVGAGRELLISRLDGAEGGRCPPARSRCSRHRGHRARRGGPARRGQRAEGGGGPRAGGGPGHQADGRGSGSGTPGRRGGPILGDPCSVANLVQRRHGRTGGVNGRTVTTTGFPICWRRATGFRTGVRGRAGPWSRADMRPAAKAQVISHAGFSATYHRTVYRFHQRPEQRIAGSQDS